MKGTPTWDVGLGSEVPVQTHDLMIDTDVCVCAHTVCCKGPGRVTPVVQGSQSTGPRCLDIVHKEEPGSGDGVDP